ncbi:P-loop containing nucleoside triphosphate hydrolase protein [Suillus subaureus]|uniref:P-loop containing nucleoside triphosphate hydrolase protein n=1 Tax=Suillus subaureus TaxID=48587 RepID=A0A9P7ELV0_9AGAM|nr:P-loop containing nucleoside triphosphate hydrolase protein [Suillus subaureus]KAG1825662.1 P-loop containing nucleoside triphosphate hydrolase protein [Suillus subaureus]
MPPRKGIVKTGNAGNSSKTNKNSGAGSPSQLGDAEQEKPLFPPGSKYPLSLLQERCQKSGWDKPTVETLKIRKRKHGNDWSFAVHIARFDKKTSQTESVRLEPHPPYLRPTTLEARHWGATYALYRFCNGLQLNRVLPPGPRDYWTELATEHKNAPEHMKWMYDADPFAARRAVDERQAKAAKNRQQGNSKTSMMPGSKEFANSPEVRMSTELRDLVEDVVKKGNALHFGEDPVTSVLPVEAIPAVTQQLGHLGFKSDQTRNTLAFLSKPSALGGKLLNSMSPLEACIEHLVLHLPECDLPARFFPGNNSSDPFIVSGHSGSDDLAKRWVEEKIIKEAGFPAYTVKECTADRDSVTNVDLLVASLDHRLLGESAGAQANPDDMILANVVDGLRRNADEVEALGAHFVDANHVSMPLFSAPVELHVFLPSCSDHSFHSYPPVYITSKSIPPYMRLHLLSQLLQEMKQDGFMESGEGFLMAAMRVLEEQWAQVQSNGSPDVSEVLKFLIPSPTASPTIHTGAALPTGLNETARHKFRRRGDNRPNSQVKSDFDKLCQSQAYATMLSARRRLPAFAAKDKFFVVVGETGCGKTTQLPQFILDSLILSGHGAEASIIITQPRRISAVSVAARVSAERIDDGSVGYAIRGETKHNQATKLLFCTTGVVLRRLGSGDGLRDVTHIVVDEVHERSVDGDFLLLELKELLARHSTLKVVLMSATINHETFVKYFNNAPMLTIPGFTHPITDMYLEDYISSISYKPASAKPNKKESEEEKHAFRNYCSSKGLSEESTSAIQNIMHAERIDYQVLIAAIVQHVIATSQRGGILIFLPGVQEIRSCIDVMRGMLGERAEILPLHANLSNDEQLAVFANTKRWKIIAATNVAETSITIEDVIYVVDSGRVKETNYDPESGLSLLKEQWVTRAAARQRRGRAGRTQPGVCYKLYTRKQEEKMSRFPIPEILRTPLESISLTVKVMRESEDVKHFLNRAIDPPEVSAMDKAWNVLEELGAIDADGHLTALGRHISMLPVDLRLGKMLVLGTIFQCLDPILTVVACLSSKPLFLSPMNNRDEATNDLLTDVNAYNECMRLQSEGKSQKALRHFCEENFISTATVREITSLRRDFLSSLSDLGFIPRSARASSEELNANSANTNIVKAVILGGLWPRVAQVHLPRSAIKFDKVQAGTVQRENTAKEYKIHDLTDVRVFLHPSSVLFGESTWKSPFLAYFQKQMTSKIFIRGATEVPMYALLLFGGPVSVNHIGGGLTVGKGGSIVKLKAWPRIGILVNQLRRLLDAQLQQCIEDGSMLTLSASQHSAVANAMSALLANDGLSG